MDPAEALAEIQALRGDLGRAVQAMLDAAEAGLRAAPEGPAREAFQAILEACAVGDIAGQRLSTLAAIVTGTPRGGADRGEAGLLNGPQAPGGGLSQAEADALF